MATELSLYSVHGPYRIPQQKVGNGREVAKPKLKDFWKKSGGADNARGCYLFCMTKGNSVVPWYVGKTAKHDFEGECFTSDKLVKYNHVLLKKPKSRPVLIFVRRPKKKGKTNEKQIGRIETWLIAQAKAVNPQLLNKKQIPRDTWAISGVIRSGPGKVSKAGTALRRAIDIPTA